jgi:type II secretion system protein H
VRAVRHRSFSLLELIVVLVLLTSAMALLAPSLGSFFRGRRLDDEARRLWALTRYAQEQAISSAVPVAVWVDQEHGEYGLEAEPGYGYTVAPLSYALGPDVEVTAQAEDAKPLSTEPLRLVWWPDGSLAAGSAVAWRLSHRRLASAAWSLNRNLPFSTFTLVREDKG